jgi:hypothetical protein
MIVVKAAKEGPIMCILNAVKYVLENERDVEIEVRKRRD